MAVWSKRLTLNAVSKTGIYKIISNGFYIKMRKPESNSDTVLSALNIFAFFSLEN